VIDTHAHLDLCEDPDAAVARARGVARVLTVGTGPEAWRAAISFAERHDGVYAILGVHPHEAAAAPAAALEELRRLQAHERVVAVGETGLDYFRDYAPHEAQRDLFRRTLALAEELRRPVVVHSRAADEDTAALLEAFRGTVVLHCFSSPGLLAPALARGYYVSFAGNVSYPKADDLRAAARAIPADRVLVETDAPYLTPQPVRGRPNEPAHVVHTLDAVAAARRSSAFG